MKIDDEIAAYKVPIRCPHCDGPINVSVPVEQPAEREQVTDDLRNAHMMIVRLCRVARVAGRHEISEKAIDLIRRQGYNPSPLRKGEKLKRSAALHGGE